MSYLVSFFLTFFSPFSIAITSLGEERANLSAFRTFVRFVLVWICWFPLPLGVWEGLWFLIVPFPGLFSYLILLSYLAGMKRRISRSVACKRDKSLSSLCSSLLMSEVCLFYSYMLPLFLSGLLSYLVGMKTRTSRRVACKKDNSHFMYLFPLMSEVYLFSKLYITFILQQIALIFGRDEKRDQ